VFSKFSKWLPKHGIKMGGKNSSLTSSWCTERKKKNKNKNKNKNNNNNKKKRSKNNKSPKLCLGDLIIIIIIRNGAKTISLPNFVVWKT
jgi:hypothetical protein